MRAEDSSPAHARGPGLAWLHHTYAVIGMIVYSGGIVDSVRYLHGDEKLAAGQTQILATITQAFLAAGLIPGLAPYRNDLLRDLRGLRLYAAIVALCLLSASWSPYPAVVARRTLTLTVCLLFGLWCSRRFGLAGTLRLYAGTALGLCALSLLAYVALPVVGREVAEGYENAMRGVYSQKNTLGESAVLGISCLLHALIVQPRRRGPIYAGVLFLMACEIMARSATSFIITLGLVAAVFFYLNRRRPGVVLGAGFVLVSVLLLFIGALAADADMVAGLLGRDATFTGRVPVWTYSMQAAMLRPLFGYGYGAFWIDDSTVVQWIWAMAGGWKAPNSHNGYLDIVLQIGLVGLCIYLVLWARIIAAAGAAAWRLADAGAVWILLLMMLNLVLNIDEGPLPYPDEFSLMMPAVILYLRDLRQRRGRVARASAFGGWAVVR